MYSSLGELFRDDVLCLIVSLCACLVVLAVTKAHQVMKARKLARTGALGTSLLLRSSLDPACQGPQSLEISGAAADDLEAAGEFTVVGRSEELAYFGSSFLINFMKASARPGHHYPRYYNVVWVKMAFMQGFYGRHRSGSTETVYPGLTELRARDVGQELLRGGGVAHGTSRSIGNLFHSQQRLNLPRSIGPKR